MNTLSLQQMTHVSDSVARIEEKGVTMSIAIKDKVRSALIFLSGNNCHFLMGSLESHIIEKKMPSFYVDTRVSTKPVFCEVSDTKIGKRDFNALIKEITAAFTA